MEVGELVYAFRPKTHDERLKFPSWGSFMNPVVGIRGEIVEEEFGIPNKDKHRGRVFKVNHVVDGELHSHYYHESWLSYKSYQKKRIG